MTTEVISLSLTSISSSLKWKLQYLSARSFSGTELIRYSHDPESKCLLKFCAWDECLAGLPLVPALGFLMQVWCVVCWFGDWSLHLSPFYMRVNAMCIYLPFARQVARQKLTIFS